MCIEWNRVSLIRKGVCWICIMQKLPLELYLKSKNWFAYVSTWEDWKKFWYSMTTFGQGVFPWTCVIQHTVLQFPKWSCCEVVPLQFLLTLYCCTLTGQLSTLRSSMKNVASKNSPLCYVPPSRGREISLLRSLTSAVLLDPLTRGMFLQ